MKAQGIVALDKDGCMYELHLDTDGKEHWLSAEGREINEQFLSNFFKVR